MHDLDKGMLERARQGEFQAIDWGSSKGGSIEEIRLRYGYSKVVGIDLDPTKVADARSAGRDVILGDATQIDLGVGTVDASFMFHFLEHLPTLSVAKKVIERACRATRSVIYIRQPMFGADEILFNLGLRFDWSTWSAHPNRMTTLDFHRILRQLHSSGVVHWFGIGYGYPVHSSEAPFIVPLEADDNAVCYSPSLHGPKNTLKLTGIYKEVCVAVGLCEEFDPEEAARLIRCDHWVFESSRPAGYCHVKVN